MGFRTFISHSIGHLIDRRLGINTTFSQRNGAIDYILLWSVLRGLRLKGDDIFVDIGCGAGRAVCGAARHNIRKVIGIELDPSRSEIARRNAVSVAGRIADIQIVNINAAEADYSEGTVFFLNNPFGQKTLVAVLERIRAFVNERPRQIRIVYARPEFEHVLSECAWLSPAPSIRVPMYNAVATVWCSAI
ncbi:MAG: methyltransferase domain-containing protein [Terriglobales bacterium]